VTADDSSRQNTTVGLSKRTCREAYAQKDFLQTAGVSH
jgi:hypothetical protein